MAEPRATMPANAMARLVPARGAVERAFLPAALEITETPASPTLRITALLISAFFLVALAWAWFGRVDIIATAPGKIIASMQTKVIQPFDTGVVRAIDVSEGTKVKRGQVLIEFDDTLPQADRRQYQSALTLARLDQARLHAQLDGAQGGDPFLGLYAPPDLIAAARMRLEAEAKEQQANLTKIDRQIVEKRADQASIDAQIAQLDASLPIVQQRMDIRASGLQTAFGNRLDYLQQRQQLSEMQHERLVTESKRDAAVAAVTELTVEREAQAAQYRRRMYDDLARADREANEATEQLAKAERRIALSTLTAPVDGTVQDLSAHTLGGVVTPAQQLMRIVPAEGGVEVEAVISNSDVGFVDVGQPVEIKVATFPFTRYGLIGGHVREVAQDSNEKPRQDRRPTGSDDATDDPANVESAGSLIFAARITLDRTVMDVDGKPIPLSPGMAVTAEIKTGRQRVIDYLLSPFQRRVHDSLHER